MYNSLIVPSNLTDKLHKYEEQTARLDQGREHDLCNEHGDKW